MTQYIDQYKFRIVLQSIDGLEKAYPLTDTPANETVIRTSAPQKLDLCVLGDCAPSININNELYRYYKFSDIRMTHEQLPPNAQGEIIIYFIREMIFQEQY